MKFYVKAKDFSDLYKKIAKIEHFLWLPVILSSLMGSYFSFDFFRGGKFEILSVLFLFLSFICIGALAIWYSDSSNESPLSNSWDYFSYQLIAKKLPCSPIADDHKGSRRKVRQALDLMCNSGMEVSEFIKNVKYLYGILVDMQKLEESNKLNVQNAKETYELLDSFLDDFIDSRKSYILGQLIEAGKRKYLKEDTIVKGIRSKYDLG